MQKKDQLHLVKEIGHNQQQNQQQHNQDVAGQ